MSIQNSIENWDNLAAQEYRMGAYYDGIGEKGSARVCRNKAETYLRTVKALQLEAETGKVHCACCLSPNSFHGKTR